GLLIAIVSGLVDAGGCRPRIRKMTGGRGLAGVCRAVPSAPLEEPYSGVGHREYSAERENSVAGGIQYCMVFVHDQPVAEMATFVTYDGGVATSDPSDSALRLVLGDEEFLVERAVRSIVNTARAADPGTELTRVQASAVTKPEFAELLSPSLFSEGRVVVLETGQEISQ